jgi:hypothetical protein
LARAGNSEDNDAGEHVAELDTKNRPTVLSSPIFKHEPLPEPAQRASSMFATACAGVLLRARHFSRRLFA